MTAAPTDAHPPSDGAHRLAWWLGGNDAHWALLAPALGAPTAIDRLLTGEIEPAEDVAMAIAAVTGGAVRPDDWLHGGSLGWADRPFARD